MRPTLLIALCSLLLTACFGSSTTTTTSSSACANKYWDGLVGTCLPEKWHVVDRAGLDQRGLPADVIVAFQADEPSAGQFATVTVTREQLPKAMDSAVYSAESAVSVQGLPGYEKGTTKSITIDGSTVSLISFSAKPKEDQPKSRFLQVSFTAGATGFTFTAAAPIAVASATMDQMTQILESATLREK